MEALDSDAALGPRCSPKGKGKGKPPPPPAQGKGKQVASELDECIDGDQLTSSQVKGKGKAKGPPSLAKGMGKQALEGSIKHVALEKPKPANSLAIIGEMQRSDGSWESFGPLTPALGVMPSEFGLLLRELALPTLPDTQWEPIIATSCARKAIERCATIVASLPFAGLTQQEQRKKALCIAEAKSPLGAEVLSAAEQWLERAWSSAIAAGGRKLELKRVLLERKVDTLLDKQLPRPDWKKALAAKKSLRMKCEECGTYFSGAIAKCPSCCPPEAPTLQRLKSVDLLRQWRQLPVAPVNLTTLQWSAAEGLMHVGGGSGGVTLLHLPEGVICLKPQLMNAAAEFVAASIATFLATRVSNSRVVSMAEDSFMHIKEAIRTAPATHEEHRNIARRNHGRTEFIGLLEFVPGLSLQGVEVHDLIKSMSAAVLQDFWRKVGRLISFDALINNVDRVPLLWDNEGNTANVMLLHDVADESLMSVVGIDQAITAIISQGPGRGQYLERLRKLVHAAFTGSWKQSTAVSDAPSPAWSVSAGLARVQEAFRVSCGTDVDVEALMEGLQNGLTHIADRWDDGSLQEALTAAAESAQKAFVWTTVDIGVQQLPSMVDFISATAGVVSEGRATSIN